MTTVSNPRMNPDLIFLRRLSNIANAIIERNEDDSSSTFTLTQEIDEKMDMLRNEAPQGYWNIPPVPLGKRFEAYDVEYLRLTCVRNFRDLISPVGSNRMLRHVAGLKSSS